MKRGLKLAHSIGTRHRTARAPTATETAGMTEAWDREGKE